MKKINKTSGDGSPIIKGNKNTVTNTFINRHGTLFKVFIVFSILSCIVIFYKFFNIGTYPYFGGSICITDRTPKGKMVDFIYRVVSNDKNLVFFDGTEISDYDCDVNLEQENITYEYKNEDETVGSYSVTRHFFRDSDDNEKDVISFSSDESSMNYQFNFYGFIDNTKIEEKDEISFENHSKYLLNYNKINSDTLNKKTLNDLSHLWLKSNSGFNINIKINTHNSGKYSRIRNGERGYSPLLNGLVQINSDWQGEQTTYTLSAPDSADVDPKRFECTKLDKPKILKFFMCPFL